MYKLPFGKRVMEDEDGGRRSIGMQRYENWICYRRIPDWLGGECGHSHINTAKFIQVSATMCLDFVCFRRRRIIPTSEAGEGYSIGASDTFGGEHASSSG